MKYIKSLDSIILPALEVVELDDKVLAAVAGGANVSQSPCQSQCLSDGRSDGDGNPS